MNYEAKWYSVNKMLNSEINKMEFKLAKRLRKCLSLNDHNQPERLNPEDHIRDVTKMVCDSLNTANK